MPKTPPIDVCFTLFEHVMTMNSAKETKTWAILITGTFIIKTSNRASYKPGMVVLTDHCIERGSYSVYSDELQ